MIVISILSLFSFNAQAINMQGGDKLAHFLFYSIFTLLMIATLRYECSGKFPFWKIVVLSGVLAFLFGVFIEFCQDYFTTNRMMEVKDIQANALGIVFAILIIKPIEPLLEALKRKI